MHAIILAGGKGRRLGDHTASKPKALVEIDGRPILGIILDQLGQLGFSRVTLCVSHLSSAIQDRFGDGTGTGVSIDYCLDQDPPLGTAGPLANVPDWTTPALVMNGDILTGLNFADMYSAHVSSGALITVAALRRHMPIDFGVLMVEDGKVQALWEKPTLTLDLCAGVYVMSPLVRGDLSLVEPTPMPDLIARSIASGKPVVPHPFDDPWFDIGTPEQLGHAQRWFEQEAFRFLPPRDSAAVAER